MCLLFFQRIGGGGWPRLPIENAILNNLGSSTLATYGPLSEYNLDSRTTFNNLSNDCKVRNWKSRGRAAL